MSAKRYKCFVLNCASDENTKEVKLFRFPKVGKNNVPRCQAFAKFCRPDGDWSDNKALLKLYNTHKCICSRHFRADAFSETNPSRLAYMSIPTINPALTPDELLSMPSTSSYDPSSSLLPVPSSLSTHSSSPISSKIIPAPETPHSASSEEYVLTGARRSLLTELNVTRMVQLTPKKQWLVNSQKKKEKENTRLRKEYKELKEKTEENILNLSVFRNIPPALKLILASTMRCAERNPTGRRWTLEDKIQALSLFKNSPRNYNFLRKLFLLPSPRTLRSLLGSIPITTGICTPVLMALKKKTETFDPRDCYVTLMFDEISIRRHLCYNRKMDKIEGYQDHKGQGYSGKVANHALVFMVQGVRRSFKQPVAYYFSSSQTSSDRLKVFICQVIRACEEAGLRVVATVCDMGSNNVRALKNLEATATTPYFFLHGRRIYTIYDPCHLLKCTRNNWRKKPLYLKGSIGPLEIKGVAKWEHVEKAVAADRQTVFQGLGHITDEHLNPKGKSLMKVKLAAQVFSHTMASHVENEHKYGSLKDDDDAMVTAFLVKFMDNLFDSTNGKGAIPYKGKTLRTRLTDTSPHIAFFQEAVEVISSWYFTGHTKTNPLPSQEGWLFTLRAIYLLWQDLRKDGFFYVDTKVFLQDGLENFNGMVRANCGGNSNPTCRQYTAGFKTAIINNFAYADMARTNCEFDNLPLIDDLHALILNLDEPTETEDDLDVERLLNGVQDIFEKSSSAITESMKEAVETGDRVSRPVAYIAGFIAKRLLAKVNCNGCSQLLSVKEVQPFHSLIVDREYCEGRKSLTYPSQLLVECVGSCLTFTDNFLNRRPYIPQLKKTVTNELRKAFDFSWLSCSLSHNHAPDILTQIYNDVFFIAVKWWCTRQNRLFVEDQRKKRNEAKVKHFKGI